MANEELDSYELEYQPFYEELGLNYLTDYQDFGESPAPIAEDEQPSMSQDQVSKLAEDTLADSEDTEQS